MVLPYLRFKVSGEQETTSSILVKMVMFWKEIGPQDANQTGNGTTMCLLVKVRKLCHVIGSRIALLVGKLIRMVIKSTANEHSQYYRK